MFDIGWSELVVIAVVALIAIGPKELPGVLRMIGQWMGKARRMASEFQGQFNEAMREAEMADIKKTFDDASSMAKDLSPTNLLSNLAGDSVKQAEEAMKIDQPLMTSKESEAESNIPAIEPDAANTTSPKLPDAKAS
ncbi:MAG: twin-arginine translocase subunit TatB [Rhizobiales bacterium]|nr:twin-arginine translocase subunit TatB [Hyphomicrobiales bacterium]